MPRRRRKSVAIATDLMLAPMVMAMRLPMMAAEAGRSGVPSETMRATSEKVAAYAEGMAAANMACAKAMWSFWPEVMTGRQPSLLSGATVEAAVQAALRPASRTVKANLRRLSLKQGSR